MTAASELQELIGDELMAKVCQRFGGELIYIPMRAPIDFADVRQVFDRTLPGAASVMSAYGIVAEQFDISPRTVRRVVSVA